MQPVPHYSPSTIHPSVPTIDRDGLVSHLDQRVLRLVEMLLPDPTRCGREVLTCLCQRAQVIQQPMHGTEQCQHIAVITTQGLPDLISQPGWKWSREMSGILLHLLEAMSVLIRFRRARRTEIHIPLGPRPDGDLFHPQVVLRRLRSYPVRSRKARRLFATVIARLEALISVQADQKTAEESFSESLNLVEQVQQALKEERVARSVQGRILFRLRLAGCFNPVQIVEPGFSDRLSASQNFAGSLTSEDRVVPGGGQDGSSTATKFQRTRAKRQEPFTSIRAIAQLSGWQTEDVSPHGSYENETSQEPPMVFEPTDQTLVQQEQAAFLEPSSETHGISEANGSQELPQDVLDQETRAIWSSLTGQETLEDPARDDVYIQIRQRLEQHPDLVRATKVNTLLQRIFPDRHGVPQDAIRWFFSTYQRYLNQQLRFSPQISSWVQSPYSYAEIEEALRIEYRRQMLRLEPLQRPFASCVTEPSQETGRLADAFAESHIQTKEPFAPSFSLPPTEPSFVSPEASSIPLIQRVQNEPVFASDSYQIPETSVPEMPSAPSERFVEVESEQIGWNYEGILWWEEKLRTSPLAQTCVIEMLPTQFGRYVLSMTPRAETERPWIWTSGAEVRPYLEEVRAAKHSGNPLFRSFQRNRNDSAKS